MEDSQTLSQSLKQAGLRLTPQRIAICDLLANSHAHPSAQMVFEQLAPDFPSLSLTTVYNTLETLVELGLVNELGSVGDSGVRYDADTEPHINLACTNCGIVIDLPSEHLHEHLTHIEDDVAQQSGYALLGRRVLYYGLCQDCQKLQAKSIEN